MIDFRQDINGDIDLTGGDIHLVESTVAHQRDLLLTGMGELKHSPVTGAGVHDFINDETPEAMLRMVRKKFIHDGMTVNSVKLDTGGKLVVDAYYDVYPVVPHFAEADNSIIPEQVTPVTYNLGIWRHGDTVKAIGFRLIENGVAVNLAGCALTAKFKLTTSANVIALTLTSGNGLTITDEADGKFRIDAMICALPAGDYLYDIEVVFGNGVIETWIEGTLTVTSDI